MSGAIIKLNFAENYNMEVMNKECREGYVRWMYIMMITVLSSFTGSTVQVQQCCKLKTLKGPCSVLKYIFHANKHTSHH